MRQADGRCGPISGRFSSFPGYKREGQYFASTNRALGSKPFLDEETARHDEKLEPGDVIDLGHPVSNEDVARKEQCGEQGRGIDAGPWRGVGEEREEPGQAHQAHAGYRIKYPSPAEKNL